jgi:outer membrane protein assembly factor BamB
MGKTRNFLIVLLLAVMPVVAAARPAAKKSGKKSRVTLEWVGYMEGYNTVSAPAVADDGSVYATTDKDRLYKFDAKGRCRWVRLIVCDPENRSSVYGTPSIDADGVVYIAAGSSNGMASCVAFNPDGSRKWTFNDFWNKGAAHNAAVNGIVAAIGKSNIYIGNNGSSGSVLAVSKADGKRKGHIASGGSGPSGGARSGIVLSDAGMVHWLAGKYGVWGASRAGLDWGEDGCPYYWNQYSTSATQATTKNLSALGCMKVNGVSCVTGIMTDKTSVKVFALDAGSGMEVSKVRIHDTGLQDQGGVAVTAEGYIVAPLNCEEGKDNGGIVIVDPAMSVIKARFNLPENIIGVPAVDKAGNIHFFSENGCYFIVRPDYASGQCVLKEKVDIQSLIKSDRRYRKSYGDMDSAAIWCSAVIGNDGRIYTCFTDKSSLDFGGVLCMSYGECSAPADSDWPMIGGNPRHTSAQKGIVVDESKPAVRPVREYESYPSLMGEAIRKGQTLTSFFDALIAEQAKVNPRKNIYIVAHRANTCAGVAAGCPDNSIAAIEMAIAMGADMVELDVRTTKDGHLVLMHDSTIDATTNGKGKVSNYTLDELRGFSMARSGRVYLENDQPVRVPTLEEALLACKGRIYINLDLKAVANPADLVDVIRKTGMQDQVMLFCGGKTAIGYQEMDESIAIHPYIGSASDIGQYNGCPGAKLFQYGYSDWMDGGSVAKDSRAKGYLTYSNLLNYDTQTTAGNYMYIDRFIESETDYLQTDCCELIAEYLRSKGLR